MVVNQIYRRARRVLVLVALFSFLMLMFVAYNGEASGQGRDIEAQLPGDTGTQTTTVEEFAEYVYEDVNDFWERELRSRGYSYSPPRELVLVDDRPVRTRCQNGDGSATVVDPEGMPMYCPADQRVYFPLNATFPDPNSDPNSRNVLLLRLDEQEDFAIAMALAHEMGHHVQKQMNDNSIPNLVATFSMGKELQADCFAGMWTRRVYNNRQLERDDLEEAVVVLYFVGDKKDVSPNDRSAHGQFEQRVDAFGVGLGTSDIRDCL